MFLPVADEAFLEQVIVTSYIKVKGESCADVLLWPPVPQGAKCVCVCVCVFLT